MDKSSLREELASFCHSQWSHWMKYLFSKSIKNPDGSTTILKELTERWKGQMQTDFKDLTPSEQESDRKEADRFISVISLTEATPKSTRERIYRTLRKDTSHRDRPRKKTIAPSLRAEIGKTGNNDPHRCNPRLHNEAIPEKLKVAVIFLQDNIKKPGEEITDAASLFKSKPELLDLIRHLIATSMGGWQQEQGCFVNDSGRTAYPEHWLLSEGRLVPKGRTKPVEYSINKLLEMKRIVEQTIFLESRSNRWLSTKIQMEDLSERERADVFHYALRLSLGQCEVNNVPERLQPYVLEMMKANE